jgi:hypothetical protein
VKRKGKEEKAGKSGRGQDVILRVGWICASGENRFPHCAPEQLRALQLRRLGHGVNCRATLLSVFHGFQEISSATIGPLLACMKEIQKKQKNKEKNISRRHIGILPHGAHAASKSDTSLELGTDRADNCYI